MIPMIWKPTLATANFVSTILVLWMHVRKNGRERYAHDRGDGSVEFPPDPLAYLAWPVIVLLPAWGAINDFQQHASGKPWSQLLLALILLAAAVQLFRFPGTVVVTHEGVEQHFWLRSEKRIRWGEITGIKRIRASGILIITASDSTNTVFSDQLADRPRFLEELERYAHGKLPPENPAGSVLGLQSGRSSS